MLPVATMGRTLVVLALCVSSSCVSSCTNTKSVTLNPRICSCFQTSPRECSSKDKVSATSCKVILEQAKARKAMLGDGVYEILLGSQRVKVYCDMTRDGGGWTLITAANTGLGWTRTTVFARNVEYPSRHHDYSILGQADGIKSHSTETTFLYRIEGNGRGRWGGIWKAPANYTFTNLEDKQTGVELIKRFDNWSYSDVGIQKRMPWVDMPHPYALLTVRKTGGDWWGTMIIKNNKKTSHDVGPWISGPVVQGHQFNYWFKEK